MLSSGSGFPEQEGSLQWLSECHSPYMASKLVAECLTQKFCPNVVTVRPGLVVWDSRSGVHNSSDALSRIAASFCRHGVAWSEADTFDDTVDGMNVDAFCQGAYAVFEHGCGNCSGEDTGGPSPVYNMRGEFTLAELLKQIPLQPTGERVVIERIPYSEWYETALRWCHDEPAHPLAALLPHIDSCAPPLSSAGPSLSAKCRAVIGPQLAAALLHCSGFGAMSKELREGPWCAHAVQQI
jgi:hypothetical protein